MASQMMYISLEYPSPLVERTFAIGATTTQNFAASVAYKVIGERSPRPYIEVGGAYAFSRILVPLAVIFAWKMYENDVEKKTEKERQTKMKKDIHWQVGNQLCHAYNAHGIIQLL
ncbi:unnamed protein product [Cochlearia groenlandica]